jgi:hypothetical protein
LVVLNFSEKALSLIGHLFHHPVQHLDIIKLSFMLPTALVVVIDHGFLYFFEVRTNIGHLLQIFLCLFLQFIADRLALHELPQLRLKILSSVLHQFVQPIFHAFQFSPFLVQLDKDILLEPDHQLLRFFEGDLTHHFFRYTAHCLFQLLQLSSLRLVEELPPQLLQLCCVVLVFWDCLVGGSLTRLAVSF